MKIKKIATLGIAGVLSVSSFMGCRTTGEEFTVSFNPKEGASYEFIVDMSMDSESLEGAMSKMNTGISAEITYTSVDKNSIVSEMKYNDLYVNMNMLGEEISISRENSEFSELYDLLSSMVYTVELDEKGNYINASVSGGEEEGAFFDLEGSTESFFKDINIFEGRKLVKGEIIEIPLRSASLTSDLEDLGFSDNEKIKCKVKEINKDKAVLEAELNDLESDRMIMDIDIVYTIDLKLGMVSSCKLNLSGEGSESNEEKITVTSDIQIKEK